MKKRVILLPILMLTLAACGSNSSSSVSESGNTTQSQTNTENPTSSVAPTTNGNTTTSSGNATSSNGNTTTSETTKPTFNTVHAGTQDDPFTIADAVVVANATGTTATTDKYYIQGYVAAVDTSGVTQYGNITLDLIDEGNTSVSFKAFQIYNIGGVKFTADTQTAAEVGDTVVVYGNIVNYMSNTPETTGKGAASLISVTKGQAVTPTYNTVHAGTQDDPFTIADAISVANTTGAIQTADKYYIRGLIKSLNVSGASSYGNINVDMVDNLEDTNKFTAYQIYNLNNVKFTTDTANDYKVGDTIVVYGNIVNYMNNTPETTGKGTAYIYSHTKADPVAVTGISVNNTLEVEQGKSKSLNASVEPSNADNKKLTYTSDAESVATVDENGKVTGVSTGTANITITSDENSEITTTVAVTVIEPSATPSEETTVSYTFTGALGSDNTSAATLSTSDAILGVFKSTDESVMPTSVTDIVKVYAGANGGSGDTAWVNCDVLKLGTTKLVGSLTLNFDTSIAISKVSFKVAGWAAETNMVVNTVSKNTGIKMAGTVTADTSATLEYEFDTPTNVLSIASDSASAKPSVVIFEMTITYSN